MALIQSTQLGNPMSLDKRIVLLRLDGIHQIVGLGAATSSFPAELRWDTGWAKLLVEQPKFVIYKEQEGLPCAIEKAMHTLGSLPPVQA